MFVLDTDICSYAMKRSDAQLIARLRTFAPQELKVSVVTVFELEYGARRSGRYEQLRQVIDAFLANVEVLALDRTAAGEAASIRASLAALGTPIGAYDLLIAAHARSRQATLVTNNTRELGRVEGLVLENWSRG